MSKITLLRTVGIGLLATTCLASPSYAEVTPYGSLRIGLLSEDGEDRSTSIQNASTRFGLKASTQLTDTTTIFGRLEYGTDPTNHKNDVALRVGEVGLKGPLGTLTIGSQFLAWHKFVRSGQMNDLGDQLRLGTARTSDLVQYRTGLGGKAELIAEARISDDEMEGDDLDHLTAGISLPMGNHRLRIAALKDNNGENTGTLIGARARFNFGQSQVELTYHSANDDFDLYDSNLCSTGGTDTANIFASHSVGSNTFAARYATKSCDLAEDEANALELEYQKKLSKKARIWLAIANNSPEVGDSTTDVQLGLRYDF